jgi:hypothetical protein
MDFLIALGTTVAYLYSVAVVFAPNILPVKVEEREVYFEVSTVIIAFVLLGKYMEEIIKKRSSGAVRKLVGLRPAVAHVVRDGAEMEAQVPAESIMGQSARYKDTERDLKHAQERTFECHRRTIVAAGAAPGVAGPNPAPILRI